MHDGSVDGMQTFDDEIEKLWNNGHHEGNGARIRHEPDEPGAPDEDAPEPTEPQRGDDRWPACSNSHDQDHLHVLPKPLSLDETNFR